MTSRQLILLFVALSASVVCAQISNDEPIEDSKLENQDASVELNEQDSIDGRRFNIFPNWVACNYTGFPNVACHNCSTQVFCLPIGGLLRPCKNPSRPHCNRGFCSANPNPECVRER